MSTEHDTMTQARAALLQAVGEGAGQKDALDRAAEMLAGRSLFRSDLHQVWKALVEEGRLVHQRRRWRVADDGPQKSARIWTAEEVLKVLKRCRHTADADWIFLDEVRIGTGFRNDADKRLDAWAIHCLPSHDHKRICYEVKVSRSDFRHEIRKPLKRRHGLLWSNLFYFVAPVGVIPSDEVPTECGLLEVVGDDPDTARILTTIQAPQRDSMWPTWNFFAAVARRMRVANEAEQLRQQLKRTHEHAECLERELQCAKLSLKTLRDLLRNLGRYEVQAWETLVKLTDTEREKEELARAFASRDFRWMGWGQLSGEDQADAAALALLYPDRCDVLGRYRG